MVYISNFTMPSESSRADWSRAMVYESVDHRNDVTCHAVPVVLFLVFRKKIKVIVKKQIDHNFSWSVGHSIEMTP